MEPAEEALPGLLVCQETLQPLVRTADGLWSEAAKRLYPIRDGLVYMGFPVRDQSMIAATMDEEHEWQGTTQTLDRDADFLRASAPQAVDFINLLGRYAPAPARVVELGSGSGWVSWLMAQAGYDTYLCDFEANSLSLGLAFTDPAMGLGRRIVADARYAPFPSGSFDVVVFKEFVHHVEDFAGLFREANRLLRDGGVVALMEPTESLVHRAWTLRNPDPHIGHHITWPSRYLRSMRRLGFTVIHVGAVYDEHVPNNPLRRSLKLAAERQAADGRPLTLLGRAHLEVLGGGQLVAIARKTSGLTPTARPPMAPIDTDRMTTTQHDRATYSQLLPIVEQAANRLLRAPGRQPHSSDPQP